MAHLCGVQGPKNGQEYITHNQSQRDQIEQWLQPGQESLA
jgi:hypothetical protein